MKLLNPFYFAVIGVAIALFFLLKPRQISELSFFGFAESKETELNYNYPVEVSQIFVTAGQSVKAGDTLLLLQRNQAKEILSDQDFKIGELKAEEAIWKQKKENQRSEWSLQKSARSLEFDNQIEQLQKELDYKIGLAKGLETIKVKESSYRPLKDKISEVQLEKENFLQMINQKIAGIQKEVDLGTNPYALQIQRYNADKAFDKSQEKQVIVLQAPVDGLVGNIICKQAEHIPSYRTLMTFYEPHSNVVKGYVHEDLTYKVKVGDEFLVTSLKEVGVSYIGIVAGLGSRIVEIPTRLRKVPEIKNYGREVLVNIPKENSFLQKEKVGLSAIPSHEN